MKHGQVVKTFKSKKGNEVVIRHLHWDDLTDAHVFANDLSKEDTFVQLSGEEVAWEKEVEYIGESLVKVAKGHRIHLVATVNGQFAGMCGLRRLERRHKHVGDVDISLDKKYREEGVGTMLLECLREEAKQDGFRLITLTCFATNERAIHVYEKVGFIKAGEIPGMLHYKNEYIGQVYMYLPLVK